MKRGTEDGARGRGIECWHWKAGLSQVGPCMPAKRFRLGGEVTGSPEGF